MIDTSVAVNATIIGERPTGLGIYALSLVTALDALGERLTVYTAAPSLVVAPRARVRINAKLTRMADRSIIASHTVERMARAEAGDLPSIALAFDEALGGAMRRIVEWALSAPGASPPQRRN